MKKVFRFLGIIAILAVIGFSMVACGGNDDDSGGSSAGSNGGGNGGSSPVPGRIPDNYLNTVWKSRYLYPLGELTITFSESTSTFKFEDDDGVWTISLGYSTPNDTDPIWISTNFNRLNIPHTGYSQIGQGNICFYKKIDAIIFIGNSTGDWKKQ